MKKGIRRRRASALQRLKKQITWAETVQNPTMKLQKDLKRMKREAATLRNRLGIKDREVQDA